MPGTDTEPQQYVLISKEKKQVGRKTLYLYPMYCVIVSFHISGCERRGQAYKYRDPVQVLVFSNKQ